MLSLSSLALYLLPLAFFLASISASGCIWNWRRTLSLCRCRSRIERVLLWLGNSAQLIEHPSAGGEVRPRTGARERSVLLANLAASCRPPRQARHCQSSSSSPPPPFPSPDLRLSQVGEQAPTSPVVRPRGGEQRRPVVGNMVKGVLADTRDPLRYAEEAPVLHRETTAPRRAARPRHPLPPTTVLWSPSAPMSMLPS